MKTAATWTQQERRMHINEPELLALKLALETFLKAQEIKSLHIHSAPDLISENVCLSKQIWELLLRKK